MTTWLFFALICTISTYSKASGKRFNNLIRNSFLPWDNVLQKHSSESSAANVTVAGARTVMLENATSFMLMKPCFSNGTSNDLVNAATNLLRENGTTISSGSTTRRIRRRKLRHHNETHDFSIESTSSLAHSQTKPILPSFPSQKLESTKRLQFREQFYRIQLAKERLLYSSTKLPMSNATFSVNSSMIHFNVSSWEALAGSVGVCLNASTNSSEGSVGCRSPKPKDHPQPEPEPEPQPVLKAQQQLLSNDTSFLKNVTISLPDLHVSNSTNSALLLSNSSANMSNETTKTTVAATAATTTAVDETTSETTISGNSGRRKRTTITTTRTAHLTNDSQTLLDITLMEANKVTSTSTAVTRKIKRRRSTTTIIPDLARWLLIEYNKPQNAKEKT